MRGSRSGLLVGLLVMVAMNVALDGQSPPDSLEGGEIFRDCTDCPEMVVIPAGSFRMRAAGDVEVASFAMGRFEVTREQYGAFVAQTGYPAGDGCMVYDANWRFIWDEQVSWRDPGFEQDRDHPVVCVSWADAAAYVMWLSGVTNRQYRLPSEAEWEYAARAGTTTSHHWGDEWRCGYANALDRSWQPDAACDDRAQHTVAVGTFEPNAFGLGDTLGNVWEHVADCRHEGYEGAPSDGVPWLQAGDCRRRVHRGGGWDSDNPTTSYRYHQPVGEPINSLGFRVARTLE